MSLRNITIAIILMLSASPLCAQNQNDDDVARSHAMNAEALECIANLLDSRIDSASFAKASSYIMTWGASSHDINVSIDETIGSFLESRGGSYYITGYIAACAEQQLLNKTTGMDWPMFTKAMSRLVEFYKRNRQFTGDVRLLERYSLLNENDFSDALRKDFKELIPYKEH